MLILMRLWLTNKTRSGVLERGVEIFSWRLTFHKCLLIQAGQTMPEKSTIPELNDRLYILQKHDCNTSRVSCE